MVFGVKEKNKAYVEREGVYGIAFNHKNQVAVVNIDGSGFLPGGGLELEDDNNKEKCLRREIIEETGYNIEILNYLGAATQFMYSNYRKEYFKLIGHFYEVILLEETNGKTEVDHELCWCDVEAIHDFVKLEYQIWAIEYCLGRNK